MGRYVDGKQINININGSKKNEIVVEQSPTWSLQRYGLLQFLIINVFTRQSTLNFQVVGEKT